MSRNIAGCANTNCPIKAGCGRAIGSGRSFVFVNFYHPARRPDGRVTCGLFQTVRGGR